MGYRRHIYFDNRKDDVNGFYLLITNDFCVHSDKTIQQLYGFNNDYDPLIYQVDQRAVEFLINKGFRFNLLN